MFPTSSCTQKPAGQVYKTAKRMARDWIAQHVPATFDNHRVHDAFVLECPNQPRINEYNHAPQRSARPVCAQPKFPMRDDYLRDALKVVTDPTILVNVISRRVKQLRRGNRPLVESLEKLSAEDTALREVAEGKISYELATPEELAQL